VDGEITDSCFYVWDLLSVNDTDLRVRPYEIRYVHLTQHFRGVSDVLRVCETAMTTKAKRDFVKRCTARTPKDSYARIATPHTRADERDSTSNVSSSSHHPSSLAPSPRRGE